MSELREALYKALTGQFRIDRTELDDETRLFSSGMIDSLSVMDLVSLIEKTLGRAIDPADITLENFDSIAQITRYADSLDRC